MKNRIKAILLTMLTLAGCAKEKFPEVDFEGKIPLNISSRINQVSTKATADGFVDNDEIGLFAVNYSNNNTVPGTLLDEGNQADNVKYVFDEANYKWVPVKNVYYKDVNTNVDLYLYYPYQASISDVNAAGFEVQKDQSTAATKTSLSGYEASDLLWGKGVNITPVESAVGISLSHKLSSVKVTLAEGEGFGEGEYESLSKSVIVTNTTRKATFNYATGEASALGSAQSDGIVMCPQEDGTFRAIVVPQSLEAGVQLFAITIDGVSYAFRQSSTATTYQAGKQVNFTINIKKKAHTGEYELELGDVQIVDWAEDRNSHGGDARQYYVVNVETLGTLGRKIKSSGKNPDKIRNLKVTGRISTKDYFFMKDSMAILESINLKETESFGGTEVIASGYYSGDKYEQMVKDFGIPDFEGRDGYCQWYNNQEGTIPAAAFAGKKSLCHFEFPDNTTVIGYAAFYLTNLSGYLAIPNIEKLEQFTFACTNISSVEFPEDLRIIGESCFFQCKSLSGTLLLPPKLEIIGSNAFSECNLSGKLKLPDSLKEIQVSAFHNAGRFIGNLDIPDQIRTLEGVFADCGFDGYLNLNGVTTIGAYTFCNCSFSGELVIPEGCTEIGSTAFQGNDFTKIIFPSTMRNIGTCSFAANSALMGELDIPEGVITISEQAFYGCQQVLSVILPESLQTIQREAFYDCFQLSKMTVKAIEPPIVQESAFDGVAKDNFTLEVPRQSIARYKSENGWSDFRRIEAHYDFSISRDRLRTLNAELSKTYTLRVPSGFSWSIESKPDWVTVSPLSGTGKSDVTVTVNEMERTSETFIVNEGSFNNPSYKQYKGRSGEIVFLLDEKDYRTTLKVEQFDYDYSDGYVKTYQTATKGNGIDIVFIGDGYDARDIAMGAFFSNAETGYMHFFDLEPYKTYKEYFNVYSVISMSDDSGIGTVNTVVDTKFGSYYTQSRLLPPNPELCFTWGKKANPSMNLSQSLVIMLINTSTYEGVTLMYGDGSAIACCPVSTDAYPYDFRGIIQHEAGGHGFGKLGDEYIYHNAFIQNCDCFCCNHIDAFNYFKNLGWFENMSISGDNTQVPWKHLIYNPKYSNYVDMYEGGYFHTRGVYRSEATSCMNNNIPYYSAISRQAIVERIMDYAGEEFTLEKFYAKDNDSFGTVTKSSNVVDRTFGVDPKFHRGSEHGSVVYMGEHPNVK